MTAVSSLKPDPTKGEVYRNQNRAYKTWVDAFNGVVYVGGESVVPRILDLVLECSNHQGWSCIINADIVVSPKMKDVEAKLNKLNAFAASSWRHEFDPDSDPFKTGAVKDNGIDFFAARREVWNHCARIIPVGYYIGHILWDTWMLGYLNRHFCGRFFNITPSRVIFHPKHGNRKFSKEINVNQSDPVLRFAYMPRIVINIP
jgi:hypothetical protein